VLTAVGVLLLYLIWYTSRDYGPFLAAQHAPLVKAEDQFLYLRNGRVTHDITLTDADGWRIRSRAVYPANHEGQLPAIVVLDGASTGRRAVDYIPSLPDVFVIAIDYPYDVHAVSDWQDLLRDLPAIRRAVFKTIGAAALVNDYLDSRPEIHPTKRAIIGYSFGGPLTPAVMRADSRFSYGAVAYAGGDIASLIAANIRTGTRVIDWLIGETAGILLLPIEPLSHVSYLAPRPFLMINGLADSRMPRANVELLFRRAREPKTMIWVESEHVGPRKDALTALVLGKIEAWLAEQRFFQSCDSTFASH